MVIVFFPTRLDIITVRFAYVKDSVGLRIWTWELYRSILSWVLPLSNGRSLGQLLNLSLSILMQKVYNILTSLWRLLWGLHELLCWLHFFSVRSWCWNKYSATLHLSGKGPGEPKQGDGRVERQSGLQLQARGPQSTKSPRDPAAGTSRGS